MNCPNCDREMWGPYEFDPQVTDWFCPWCVCDHRTWIQPTNIGLIEVKGTLYLPEDKDVDHSS